MSIFTASQMLKAGLDLARIGAERQARLSKSTKCRKFKSHFGCHPLHAARAWRDIVTASDNSPYHVPEDRAKVQYFLAALNFLKCYQTYDVRADLIGENEKTVCAEAWYFTKKIAALRHKKIVWPSDDEWKTIFIVSVDGTHCRINEPRDPDVRKNPKHYSHKDHHAGLNYEIAIHIFESRVVHAKVGSRASSHDITEFRKELKEKIPPGKRVIADKAYTNAEEEHILSTYNQFDADAVKQFKKRVRARHESFNAIMKEWRCLDIRYRHGRNKTDGCEEHQRCFDAVLVMCQYLIEDTGDAGRPLFDA